MAGMVLVLKWNASHRRCAPVVSGETGGGLADLLGDPPALWSRSSRCCGDHKPAAPSQSFCRTASKAPSDPVELKNTNTLIRPVRAFLHSWAVCHRQASRAYTVGDRRGQASPEWWISPIVKESSTGMGPPLTGSPGRCTESERERCGEPEGGQHNRMLRQLARAHRMTEHSSSIGCCCASPDGGAFQERPAQCAGRASVRIP